MLGAAILQLNDARLQRFQRGRVFDGHARDPGLGIVHELETVGGDQRIQRLCGREVLPTNGDVGLSFDLSAFVRLAVANLGVQDVIDAGLAREVVDRGGQGHILELDERDGGVRHRRGNGRRGGSGFGRSGSRGGFSRRRQPRVRRPEGPRVRSGPGPECRP